MAKRYIAQPFAAGPALAQAGGLPRREGIAETDDTERHIHDNILAVLFTRPGERVMRPRFGAGLDAQIFDNISPLAVSALEYRIRESLERNFADELILYDVDNPPSDRVGANVTAIDYWLRAAGAAPRLEVVT
jgi:phage baseplate assembly protein W